MTEGNIIIVGKKEYRIHFCEMCHSEDVVKPFGPHGENICFSCAMKNHVAVNRWYEFLNGGQT